jgi:hypothetical protein
MSCLEGAGEVWQGIAASTPVFPQPIEYDGYFRIPRGRAISAAAVAAGGQG